jgi:hypothetical protein
MDNNGTYIDLTIKMILNKLPISVSFIPPNLLKLIFHFLVFFFIIFVKNVCILCVLLVNFYLYELSYNVVV